MNSLAQITDPDQKNEIFRIDAVQAAIDYRWRIVKPYANLKVFYPYLVYMFTYLYYIFNITEEIKDGCDCLHPVPTDTEEGGETCPEVSPTVGTLIMTSRIVLMVLSVYLLGLECVRMKRIGFSNYWISQKGWVWNWLSVIPNLSILSLVIYLFVPGNCMGMWIYSVNGITFFFLSLRIIYFLGFSSETAKFTEVLTSVASELVIFIVVLVLLCFMFVVPFMMLDKGNRKLRDESGADGDDMFPVPVDGPADMALPIIHLYFVAIGEYGMTDGFEGDSVVNYYAAIIIFFFVTIIIQLIMMNLIISIID
jgi:hypothetical protein